jgi:hypothetical protein
MIGPQEDTKEVSAVAEEDPTSPVRDVIRGAGVLVIEATGLCTKPLAATVEKSAKYLLDQQTASRFIAAIVLRKWEVEDRIRRALKETISELQHQVSIKTRLSSTL